MHPVVLHVLLASAPALLLAAVTWRLVWPRWKLVGKLLLHPSLRVDLEKTLMVGPNEAGKTAILQALQHLKPPDGTAGLEPLRDYPRRLYNDISSGKVDPADVDVVTGWFQLEADDKAEIPAAFHDSVYRLSRRLNGKTYH